MAFLGVNFTLQKLCQCKKNDNYKVCVKVQNYKVQATRFWCFYEISESCHLKLVQFKLRASTWMSTSMNRELLKGSNVLKTISSARLHYWALQNDPSSCNNCLTAIIFKMCNSQCIENVSTSVLNHVCTVDNHSLTTVP